MEKENNRSYGGRRVSVAAPIDYMPVFEHI